MKSNHSHTGVGFERKIKNERSRKLISFLSEKFNFGKIFASTNLKVIQNIYIFCTLSIVHYRAS